jgi:membrane-bound lytic murein transglycosylase D
LSQKAGDQQLILGKNKNYAIQQQSIDIYHCDDEKRYFSVACFEKNKGAVLMMRIKSNYVAYTIVFSLVFALPLFGCAQNVVVRKPLTIASAEITKQAIKKEDPSLKEESKDRLVKEENKVNSQKEESNFFNFNSNGNSAQQNGVNEEKQEMMEKALDLLGVADRLWEKGDIEDTLNTLDEAYALLLNANGDVAIAQEKDDLRLLISKRILAVYSSKRTVLNGKNSEIPLIMNSDVEKEIRSFQGIERDNFIAAYQRSGMYRSAILKALKKAGIPEEFFWLPLVESFFKINAYSRARALGLWQFIPSTGYKFGLSRDEWIDERMDVQKSTQAAIAYLKELHNMFGDWLTVLAAYNCGEGRVLRVISRQNINYLDGFWDLYRQLPHETARYVPRLLATLHIVKDPQKYGFDLSAIEKPINLDTVKVNKIMKLKDIADKTGVSEEELNLLNSELRYKMTPDHEYDLKLPKESVDKFNLVANDIPQSEKPHSLSVRTVFIKHKVRRGETITSIANKYDVPESVIMSHNKLGKKKLVQGKRLKIPITRENQGYASSKSRQKSKKIKIASSGRYKVKKGENLSMIARRFEISSDQIKELNDLKTDKICMGQTLKLPSNKSDADLEDKNENGPDVKRSVKKTKGNKSVLSSNDPDQSGANKYVVTKNDNLHSIARKNNINVAKLMELNKISLDEKLVPGQILMIK